MNYSQYQYQHNLPGEFFVAVDQLKRSLTSVGLDATRRHFQHWVNEKEKTAGFGFNVHSSRSDRMTLFLIRLAIWKYNFTCSYPVGIVDKTLVGLVGDKNKCYVWINVAFLRKNPMYLFTDFNLWKASPQSCGSQS